MDVNISESVLLHVSSFFSFSFQILSWDEKAIYLQHTFERQRDKFICAIVFVNVALLGMSPQTLLEEISGRKLEVPLMIPELKKWVESNQLSSERLRKIA